MKSKIGVLIVAANLKIAGAQKMIEQLVLNLDRNEFRIRLLVLSAPMNTAIERRLEDARVDVKYLYKEKGFHPTFFRKVRKEVVLFCPDIIHTHVNSWLYVIPSVILDRKRMIHTIHSSPERQEANAILRYIITKMYKKELAIPVAISDKIRDDAVCIYGLPKNKIERIYNPVDYTSFAEKKKIVHNEFVFVNVARFNKIKNHDILIRAFSKVCNEYPAAKLVLAGEGELLQESEALASNLGIKSKVVFSGNVEDVSSLLAQCDVFVLPSKSEGMPVSLLEAEAAAMPIIASDVGGIPDVVDSNGILVKVNNLDSLVSAMEYMIENPIEREQMGIRSQEIARRYSAKTITEEYETLYRKYGANSI